MINEKKLQESVVFYLQLLKNANKIIECFMVPNLLVGGKNVVASINPLLCIFKKNKVVFLELKGGTTSQAEEFEFCVKRCSGANYFFIKSLEDVIKIFEEV